MDEEKSNNALIEDLNRRLKALFESCVLSDEEKRSLSNEVLRILFGSGDEVIQ
jgi:hypothetical protein